MATKTSLGSRLSAIRSLSKLLRPLSARAAASKMSEAVGILKLGRINRRKKKAERVKELIQAKKSIPAKKKAAPKKSAAKKKYVIKAGDGGMNPP